MKWFGGPQTERPALYAAAGALLLGGPIWHYLYVNFYPFYRIEAAVMVLVAAVIGAVSALIAHRIGGVLGTLGMAALLFLFVDLQTNLHLRLRAEYILGIVLVAAFVLGSRKAALICITLTAFYLSALPRASSGTTYALRTSRSDTNQSSQPVGTQPEPKALLHVILDEHWGVGAFRAAGETATADFLVDYYERLGFTLYTAAYSRYPRTLEAVPAMLSMGLPFDPPTVDSTPPRGRKLRTNPYFSELLAKGYSIRVFQNAYLNYCMAPGIAVKSCTTQSGNSIANIGYRGGSAISRGVTATRFLLAMTSRVYESLRGNDESFKRATAGGALRSLEQLEELILSNPPGSNAYFVHALLPHRPLELDAECRAASPANRVTIGTPKRPTDPAWQQILTALGAQTRCAEFALGKILAALDKSVGRQNATVIIQGDHGARIFEQAPDSQSLSTLSAEQLNGSYPTLLAVRAKGFPPGIVREPVPVQDFVWQFARNGFQGPVKMEFSHFVRAASERTGMVDSIRYVHEGDMMWARR